MRWLPLVLLAGCTPDPITEVMVVVTSDLPNDQIRGMQISVTPADDANKILFSNCSCVGANGCPSLPVKLGLVSQGNVTHTIRVRASAWADPGCQLTKVVEQSGALQFYAKKTLELDLSLLQICRDKVCDPGSTCYDDGLCKPDNTPPVMTYNPNPDLATHPDGGSGPSTRDGEVLVYDPVRDRTVMFGGNADFLNPTPIGDTWEWDGQVWTAASSANGPAPDYGVAFMFDPTRNKVLTYGGLGFDNTFVYDGQWHELTSQVGPASLNQYPRMVWDAGHGAAFLFDENLEAWTLDNSGWHSFVPSNQPPNRRYFALAYHSASQKTVLFGGDGTQDTWIFDGSDWSQFTPSANPAAADGPWMVEAFGKLVLYSYGQTWEWNGDWTHITDSGPPTRDFTRLAFDSKRQVVIMFGGWDGTQLLNDTWEYGVDRVWRQR